MPNTNSNTNSNKIGLISATIICMNAMIGAGIFTTPAKLATSVGPAGILTYIFVIISVLFMALSLARVAQAYPQEGSFYTYSKQWGGHIVGIISASAYIIGVIIAIGLLTQIAAEYVHTFIPNISLNILGVLIIAIIISLNMAGVKIMQTGQMILLACTLFALFSTTILCSFNAQSSNLTPFMPNGVSSLFKAMSTAIFAFFGFESAASLYNFVKKPEKNVPKALIISLIIVGLIYLSFITSIILAIPKEIFTDAKMPISQAISTVFPNYSWLAKLIGVSILTAICGVIQSMSYSTSALTYSLFKHINNKYIQNLVKSKHAFQYIIFLNGAFILFNFFAVKSMNLFFNFTALFVVFAFITSILTLIIKKHDSTTGKKLITILGLTTACIIFANALYGILKELINF